MTVLLAVGPASAASVGLVGGGTYGESVNVQTSLNGTVVSGPTPAVTLPAGGGGPFTNRLLSANVPGVLSVGLMDVSTEGAFGTTGFVRSSARVANVDALNGVVTATALESSCAADAGGNTSGSTTLVGVRVLVAPVAVNPLSNTVVPVPGVGTATLNEQQATTGPEPLAMTAPLGLDRS